MSEDRIESYRCDVYNFVFNMLDGEIDWTGDDAGRVAAQTAKAFEAAVRAVLSADASDALLASPPEPKPEYQPKTGAKCSCKRGVQRDNCPVCEGTGWVIDFAQIRSRRKGK